MQGLMVKDNTKKFRSKDYNYNFNTKTGFFMRWGETTSRDPEVAPAPEILDIEISTICHGINGSPCKWCYKSNTGKGENMSLETFKKILHKLPKSLTQIAFGIGDIDSNPDLFKIMEYCRTNDYNKVVPNITINGWNLTDEYADKLAKLCGAVAVSQYKPKDVCYDAVKKLTDRGMKQVNIHKLLSQETYKECFDLMYDIQHGSKLKKLNAVVFLMLKPKGKRNNLTPLRDAKKYKKLVNYALKNNIRIGFDSCSAPMFLESVKGHKQYKMFETLAEPCESFLFSLYINADGKVYPCSFLEDKYEPIDVVNCEDFTRDVWNGETAKLFRKKLLETKFYGICRGCPEFNLY